MKPGHITLHQLTPPTKHSLLGQNLVNTTNGDGRIFGHSEQVHEDSETLSSSGNSALANPALSNLATTWEVVIL